MAGVKKTEGAEGEDLDKKIEERAAEIEAEGADDADDREDPDARPEPDADDPPAPKPRKDNRWQQMNERTTAAEERASRAEAQLSQTLALLQERTRTPEPKKEDAVDPLAEKLGRIKRERALLMREIQAGAGKFTKEQMDEIEKRAEALEEEHVETLAERLVTKRGLGQPQTQVSEDVQLLKGALRMQYPDVLANPRAVAWARGYYQMEVAKGRADSGPQGMQLVIEAHQKAREALKTAPATPRTDPNAPARRVGMGAGPGAGARDDAAPSGLTKEQKKMADALYGNEIPDAKKRYEKWAKGPGARLAAAKS